MAVQSNLFKPLTRWLLIPLLAIAVLGVIVWESGVKYHFVAKRWDTVVAGKLYRSGMLSPSVVEKTWREHDVQVVVNLGRDETGNPPHIAAQAAAKDLGIDRRIYALQGDGTGDPESYVQALTTIVDAARQDKAVHVHCSGGVYRTGATIALYRVFIQGWNGRDAYQDMIDHGAKTELEHPLIPYLNRNMGLIARRLEETGAIAQVPLALPVLERP